MEGRKRREIDPDAGRTARMRRAAQERQGNAGRGARTHRHAARVPRDGDALVDAVKRMPRKTLLKMMRMGERIAKVIGE